MVTVQLPFFNEMYVVDRLIDGPPPGFRQVCLMGNHEDALLAFLDGRRDAREGRPPWGWALLTRAGERRSLLLQGWRSDVCGQLLQDVLDGKISLRVGDPRSDHPLMFEHRDGQSAL